jgi:hypothetical protein
MTTLGGRFAVKLTSLFFRIVPVHLACYITSLLYLFCTGKEGFSVLIFSNVFVFGVFMCAWVPMLWSLCWHFLNVMLLSTHVSSICSILHPSDHYCFFVTECSIVTCVLQSYALSANIVHFDWHYLCLRFWIAYSVNDSAPDRATQKLCFDSG